MDLVTNHHDCSVAHHIVLTIVRLLTRGEDLFDRRRRKFIVIGARILSWGLTGHMHGDHDVGGGVGYILYVVQCRRNPNSAAFYSGGGT